MNQETLRGFAEEMSEITKEAGIFGSGLKTIRQLIGGQQRLGNVWRTTSRAFKRGMKGTVRGRAGGGGQIARGVGQKPGFISGVREALKTPGGAAAATGAAGLGAGWLGLRALRGGGDGRR